MKSFSVLLVIGIHREELAFGQTVVEGLNKDCLQVLTVPEGISGTRPLIDQQFTYETLHRALYLQLLPHVQGRHALLIDLHAGSDPAGPSADLICADISLRACMEAAIRGHPGLAE